MASIGSAPGIILGVGVGAAAGAALAPAIEVPKQQAWKGAPNRILEVGVLAQLVARGGIDLSYAKDEAELDGYKLDKLEALIYLAQSVPGAAEALTLWRLGLLGAPGDPDGDALFQHALTKAGLDPRFAAAIIRRKTAEVLELGALSTAVHRGIVNDAGLLVTTVPTGEGHVKRIPVSTIDTVAEFAALGIDKERARVNVAVTGLPLALGEMLSLLNRDKVTETDVKVSIAESNVRNEYMDVALALRRRLLTPHEYAEAELRGVKSHPDARDGAALSGLEEDDYKTLFAIMGRPLAEHQITTGLARGGTYGGTYDDVPEGPYRDSIRRSAIRPEYAPLAYANRYSYPTGFQIKSEAATDGYDFVHGLLLEIGWKPELAKHYAEKWAGGAAVSAADPHVKSEQTRLRTTAHNSYVKGEIGTTDATTALVAGGVDAAAVPAILAVWDAERALIRKQLSVAQIQKALKNGVTNPATGVAWTGADATAAFLERGYDAADAATLVAEA